MNTVVGKLACTSLGCTIVSFAAYTLPVVQWLAAFVGLAVGVIAFVHRKK